MDNKIRRFKEGVSFYRKSQIIFVIIALFTICMGILTAVGAFNLLTPEGAGLLINRMQLGKAGSEPMILHYVALVLLGLIAILDVIALIFMIKGLKRAGGPNVSLYRSVKYGAGYLIGATGSVIMFVILTLIGAPAVAVKSVSLFFTILLTVFNLGFALYTVKGACEARKELEEGKKAPVVCLWIAAVVVTGMAILGAVIGSKFYMLLASAFVKFIASVMFLSFLGKVEDSLPDEPEEDEEKDEEAAEENTAQ